MKCPECKAWTSVLETPQRLDGSVRRRYECANLHRFTTLETRHPERQCQQVKAQ